MHKSVTFEKVVQEGNALGYVDGRPCFCVGPLPGETAEVEIIKDKKNFLLAAVRKISIPSSRRNSAVEDHFLSCSPWQGVDYEYQLELKLQILAESFARPELKLPVDEMVGAAKLHGYRNKLEFSLLTSADKKLSLAFHRRSSLEDLIGLPDGCSLGSEAMNEAALKLLERVNTLNISGYIETLTVRQSQTTGSIVGIVALHQVAKRDWSMLMIPQLAGVVVSRVRSRNVHETVWSDGNTDLSETIEGIEMKYPYDGFFQTNVPMFKMALSRILSAIPKDSVVVDLYGGAGTIGLPAARIARKVTGVEISPSSADLSAKNAAAAGLANYSSVAVSTERMDPKILADVDCVVVDPPRAGLHTRVIDNLLTAAPKRIIYLSCNPVTQSRDMIMLSKKYRARGVTGFDFYPGTLHLESLVILDLI